MSATAEAAGGRLQRAGVIALPGLLRRILATAGGALSAGVLLAWAVVAVLAVVIAPADPFAPDGPPLAAPSTAHLFGTDALGRDLFSGVVYGARTSFLVAAGVAVLVAFIGTAVGLLSGLLGGWPDDVLMRLTEALQVLPRFFLALVVVAFFGPGLNRLVLVLGLTSWPLLARVVRAEVLSLRHRDFVDAALVSDASRLRIAVREILPNALSSALACWGWWWRRSSSSRPAWGSSASAIPTW